MATRLQLDNNDPEEEVQQPPSDRIFYMAILAGVSVFVVITYPYREVRIPTGILATIAFLAVCGLMLASYLRPQYYWSSIAFCVYIPFSGEYPGDFGNILKGFNFTNILILPVILQWAMQRSYMKERLLRFNAPDLPLLLFCFFSSISVLRVGIEAGGVPFADQFVRLKRWLFPFLLYFLFVNTKRNERGVKHLIITICVALTAIAILTMKESYDIGPRGTWDRIRVRGVLGSPNGTGAFFVYYTLLFLGFFLCYWRQNRYAWLLLIPFFLCGRAMTLANSRGGLIAFTLAILATILIRSRALFAVALVTVLLGLQYPQYLPETISGRLLSTVRPKAPDETPWVSEEDKRDSVLERLDVSSQGRRQIWGAGVRMVKGNPWFGYGYGEFPKQVGYFGQDGEYDLIVSGRDPHNSYLGIAAEMGVIALSFFVATLILILRSCLHVYRHGADLFMRSVGLAGVGMMLGVMSANFFGSRLDTTELTAYLWILSAIIVQYDRELRLKERVEASQRNAIVVDPWRTSEAEEIL